MRLSNSSLTDHTRRFVDLTLRRTYEDDEGGHQPDRRIALIRKMDDIWHGRMSEEWAIKTLTELLFELHDQQPVYTHEDVIVLGVLCRLYMSEPMSPLGIAAGFGKWHLTRILQSRDLRVRYLLEDANPTLIPISEVHR